MENLIQRLEEMGCTNIKIEGVAWSFDPPTGRRWAGGIGAVRNYINGERPYRRRARIRLSINHVEVFNEHNGG